MKLKTLFLSALILILSGFFILTPASSDELDDITKQINDLTNALNQSKAATAPLESQLNGLRTQIEGIKANIFSIENEIATKTKNIDKGYADLAKQTDILNRSIRNFYIKSYYFSPLITFLSVSSAENMTQILAYQKAVTDQDKEVITNIALTINNLEDRRKGLESDKVRLASIKASLDTQSAELDKIVSGAKAYQSELSGKIAELTARQSEIINARSGTFIASIGDSELADDYNASIKGFREQAPGGYFAAFSFGAHTHRKGMSQYGARGRAQAGQNYKQILSKYYGKEPVGKDTGGTIKVAGFGEMDFEFETKSSGNLTFVNGGLFSARKGGAGFNYPLRKIFSISEQNS